MKPSTQRSTPKLRKGLALPSWSLREQLAPYLFIAPYIAAFILLLTGPALYSLVLSFFDYRGYGSASWVGLENYERLLTYHQFWTSVANTAVYWIGSAIVTIVVSFFLAYLVYSSSIKGKNVYRPLIFLPRMMAPVSAALVFQTIFDSQRGVINSIIDSNLPWDQNQFLGWLAVILMRSWSGIGWFFIVFLAGLTTINPSLLDAARVEGANTWQVLRFVILPLMRPTFLFVIVTISIYSFQMFAEPNLVFPGNDQLAPSQFQPVMNQVLQNLNDGEFGTASAAAWLIFIPIVIASVVIFRLLQERAEKGAKR